MWVCRQNNEQDQPCHDLSLSIKSYIFANAIRRHMAFRTTVSAPCYYQVSRMYRTRRLGAITDMPIIRKLSLSTSPAGSAATPTGRHVASSNDDIPRPGGDVTDAAGDNSRGSLNV